MAVEISANPFPDKKNCEIKVTCDNTGVVRSHYLIIDGKVSDIDPSALTDEDKVFMSLQYDITFL